ncbi:MAG: heme exporter protein CcmD [Pseudomonadota bacterium]
MMVDLGKYAGDVFAAYAITLTALAGLVLWSYAQAKRAKSKLASLEAEAKDAS